MSDSYDDLITKLGKGWTLTNRGVGWWLSSPREPYKTPELSQIPDGAVEHLERSGVIKCEMRHNSYHAFLCATVRGG